jgi:hypothetical protein
LDIAWTAPFNGGSALSSYTITIRQSDGLTYSVDSTNCDGSDPSATTCTVPIATLLAAPYSLYWGDSVYAKVKATNVVGISSESSEGNGAILMTYPDAPVSLANDVATTSSSTIGLTWTAGAEDGGTPVIDYRISAAASGTSSFAILATGITTTSYATTTLTAGNSYIFKVESRNVFGYSTSFSNEVTIL